MLHCEAPMSHPDNIPAAAITQINISNLSVHQTMWHDTEDIETVSPPALQHDDGTGTKWNTTTSGNGVCALSDL
jgi:hypothetical protein